MTKRISEARSAPKPVTQEFTNGTPLVPFHGGPSPLIEIPFPDVPQWVQSLAERNGCQSGPVPLPANAARSVLCYPGGPSNADVLFNTLAGGGHTWPGGEAIPSFLVGKTIPDVDATRLMWGFFKEHPLAR